jgi:hypothetical protein
MKILIEIETRDIQTLADAKGLIELYTLALGQKTDDKTEEKEVKKTSGKRIRPTKAKEPEPKEPEPKEPEPKETVALGDLKNAAKDAAARTDRETVLKVINRYGSKLSEVSENNYAALLSELERV